MRWVPGRVIGGTAMIVGSIMWLTAMVLRYFGYRLGTFTAEQSAWFAQQPFAAPAQLAAYAQHPRLVMAGYAVFAGSCIVLAFGVLTLARVVAANSPVLAHLAATAVVASLFGRLYFSGVDLTAFRLVDAHGLQHRHRLRSRLLCRPVIRTCGSYRWPPRPARWSVGCSLASPPSVPACSALSGARCSWPGPGRSSVS